MFFCGFLQIYGGMIRHVEGSDPVHGSKMASFHGPHKMVMRRE